MLNIKQDDFFDEELLFKMPNYVELNDENEFSDTSKQDSNLDVDDNISTIGDEEFQELLKELGTLKDVDESLVFDTSSEEKRKDIVKDTQKDFELEKELVYAKLYLEYEQLEFEKKKFERDKEAWETLRRLSEESFQREKEEYEKQKKLEKEKMYLETKEVVNSCASLKELLENYKKIRDVSE